MISLALIASIGGFLLGFDTAVISVTIGFVKSQFHLNEWREGWYVSSALLGSIAGVTVTGVIDDYYGRKNTLIVSARFFGISAAGCLIATEFIQLVIYRFLGGIGVGIAIGCSADSNHVKDLIAIRYVPGLRRAYASCVIRWPVHHSGNEEQKPRRD